MTPRTLLLICLPTTLTLLGCERKTVVIDVPPPTPMVEPEAKTKTFETARLGHAVDAYERTPSSEKHADVKKALADLDGEIAELETLVAKRTGSDREEAAGKLKNLQTYRAQETARFTAAEAKGKLSGTSETDTRSGADKAKDGAERAGEAVENAGKKVGDTIKDLVR